MQKSNLSEELKAEIVVGVVLVTLFVLVIIMQSGTSLSTQSLITNLFSY